MLKKLFIIEKPCVSKYHVHGAFLEVYESDYYKKINFHYKSEIISADTYHTFVKNKGWIELSCFKKFEVDYVMDNYVMDSSVSNINLCFTTLEMAKVTKLKLIKELKEYHPEYFI